MLGDGGKRSCKYYDTCGSALNCTACESYNKDGVLLWQHVHGVLTPGGDPAWVCPNCGGGQHVYGVENINHPVKVCPNCGVSLKYPR